MSQPRRSNSRQKIDLKNSSQEGQVGQAGQDVFQFQFLFGGKAAKIRHERQNRKALLDKVRYNWVESYLDRVLNQQAAIELSFEKRRDALDPMFNLERTTSSQRRRSLPEGTKIIDLFNELGEDATFLILGEPGSGKTIALVQLTRSLLEQAEGDENQPIPVVFNLSSWQGSNQEIFNWLIYELWNKYQVSVALGKKWVNNEQLLLLLDGLDEVRTDLQNDCVLALNQFNQKFGRTKIVVCSRVHDYEVLSNRLKFKGAVFLNPLTDKQVSQYLDKSSNQLSAVKALLQTEPVFQQLVTTPLMLNVIASAYQGSSEQDLPQGNSSKEYLPHIFDAYIKRMFSRRNSERSAYKEEDSKRWLSWLARKLSEESKTIFLIEDMQPYWLENNFQRILYSLIIGLSLTVVLVPFSFDAATPGLRKLLCLVFLFFGLYQSFSLSRKLLTREINNFSSKEKLKKIPEVNSSNWSNWISVKIQSIEVIKFSWELSKVFQDLFLMILGLILLIKFDLLNFSLYLGLIFLLRRLDWHPQVVENKVKPNQGIQSSTVNGLCIGFIGALCTIPIAWQNTSLIPSIITIVLGISLATGFGAALQHLVLRTALTYFGRSTPWNYARFLNYATERIFLYKVGNGYIFIHRLLLEHFAGFKK